MNIKSLLLSFMMATSTPGLSTVATTTGVVAANVPIEKVVATTVSVEAYIRDFFEEHPLLVEIAKCESEFRQFTKAGEVLKGIVNNQDIGIMQINEFYHLEDSIKLGYDIYTIDGNLGYAKWLYEKQGDGPWIHSKPCWGKYKELLSKK